MPHKHLPALIISLLACVMIHAGQLPVDLSQFEDATKERQNQIVFSESFDEDLNPQTWFYIPTVFRRVPQEGFMGTAALYHERLSPNDRLRIMKGRLNLKHGFNYECRFKYRSEDYQNLRRRDTQALPMVNVIFRKAGKWTAMTSSFAQHKNLRPGQWQDCAFQFHLPQQCDGATFDLYLSQGVAAKVWLDNLEVRIIGQNHYYAYPLNAGLRLNPQQAILRMFAASATPHKPETGEKLGMVMEVDGQKLYSEATNRSFACDFGKLPPGNYPATIQLLDLTKKKIILRETWPMQVPKHNPPKGHATIDSHGRTMVDGKPFLPIAIFSGFSIPPTVEHLRQWKNAGFNTLMYYHPIKYLYIDGRKPTQAEDIISSLNRLDDCGLKLIFSVFGQYKSRKNYSRYQFDHVRGLHNVTRAVVSLVRNHPAILGYYLSDEYAFEDYHYVQELRQRVNDLDPYHLTVTLTNTIDLFEPCAKTGDVLSWDYYPVDTQAPEELQIDYRGFRQASRLGIPHWFTPQAMCWTRRGPQSRPPLQAELRAMCLAALIYQVKGFMFYSYPSVVNLGKLRPETGRQFWADIQQVVKLIHELSPWILSTENAPDAPTFRKSLPEQAPKSIATPEVIGRFWRHQGKLKLLLVTNGPGMAQADFTCSQHLKSRFGLTRKLNENTYRFAGLGVTADVLEED